MTTQLPADGLSSDAPVAGSGVPPESRGVILQRGGDELLLERAADRFAALPEVHCDFPWGEIEGVRSVEPLRPGLDLLEIQVDPVARDRAMVAARTSGEFAYVTHGYCPPDQPTVVFYPGTVITIQFTDDAIASAVDAIVAPHGLRFLRPLDGIPNTYLFELTAAARENPLKIANRLMGNPSVLSAEPDVYAPIQRFYRPNDTHYGRQWYLQHGGGGSLAPASHIDVERAWDITRGDRAITVAVIDDGFDLNHPDFKGSGKIIAPRDIKDGDSTPLPGDGNDNHGTACAGVAIAEENGTGIVGVAPRCSFMPIRTTGYLDDSTIETLLDWCISRGAAVISCSWGPSAVRFPLSTRQRAALNRAATQGRNGKGCVIVFASGNANRPIDGTVNERNWPNNNPTGATEWLSGYAVHPDTIAVAASTSLNRKAAYSNWGQSISVCAPSNNAPPGIWLASTGYIMTPPDISSGSFPGEGVFTTDRLGTAGYGSGDFTGGFGGTSSAAPVVAGVAALVLSANPNLTAAQVRQILESTADKITDPNPDPQLGLRHGTYGSNGHCQWFGHGKVNAYRAVAQARQLAGGGGGSPSPSPVPVPTPGVDDVRGHWAEPFIRGLISRKIMSGFAEDGTFRPYNSLTRAQFAALLVQAFGDRAAVRSGSSFRDVASSFWGASAIDRCFRLGFLAGFPDGTFRPNDPLTRAQAIVAIVNGLRMTGGALDLLGIYGDRDRIPAFARDEVATATLRRLVVNYPRLDRIEAERGISRGEVSAILYQALVSQGIAPPIASPYIVEPGGWFGTAASPMFTDTATHWADEFISVLAIEGIMSGYPDGRFRPNDGATRSQFAALLLKAFNPAPIRDAIAFTDVPANHWAASAIARIYRGGFMAGTAANRFEPDAPVTRLQVAVAIATGLKWPEESPEYLDVFRDRVDIPAWAWGRVAAIALRRVPVNHPRADLLAPNRPATRAELAGFVHQALVAEGVIKPVLSDEILP
jgi:subtilisin family serine protease